MTILRQAITTEKSTRQPGVHAFAVAPAANKALIRAAIVEKYKVTPRRINIINLPRKKIVMRGKVGMQPGLKKAIVYLKAGDKITLA